MHWGRAVIALTALVALSAAALAERDGISDDLQAKLADAGPGDRFDLINGQPDPYDDNGHGPHAASLAAGDGGEQL